MFGAPWRRRTAGQSPASATVLEAVLPENATNAPTLVATASADFRAADVARGDELDRLDHARVSGRAAVFRTHRLRAHPRPRPEPPARARGDTRRSHCRRPWPMTRGLFRSLLMMAKAAIAPVAAAAASLPANRGSMGTHCISSLLALQLWKRPSRSRRKRCGASSQRPEQRPARSVRTWPMGRTRANSLGNGLL